MVLRKEKFGHVSKEYVTVKNSQIWKKNQIKLTEIKSIILNIWNSMDSLNSKLDIAKERIWAMGIIQKNRDIHLEF